MTNLYDDARPTSLGLEVPDSAMTFGAHPDDAVLLWQAQDVDHHDG